MNRISVMLAEDHTIVREGFRAMLELDAGLVVVGEAQDGRQAVALAIDLRPDVILMDIAMPRLNGLEATRQLRKVLPGTRVLILSAHNDDAYVKDAIASGAVGFLLKQSSAHDVCEAIRIAHLGKNYFSPSITRRLNRLHAPVQGRADFPHKKPTLLTRREAEVLQLIAEGRTRMPDRSCRLLSDRQGAVHVRGGSEGALAMAPCDRAEHS
jgi:DNA-binding NarL/FixJ family response regulator